MRPETTNDGKTHDWVLDRSNNEEKLPGSKSSQAAARLIAAVCKSGSYCTFSACKFYHGKACRDGEQCTHVQPSGDEFCIFYHGPNGRIIDRFNSGPARAATEFRLASIIASVCSNGPGCTQALCKSWHGQECRDGEHCTHFTVNNVGCYFYHGPEGRIIDRVLCMDGENCTFQHFRGCRFYRPNGRIIDRKKKKN